ncbi:MAG: VOC family protein [Chloroflexota bacterium]
MSAEPILQQIQNARLDHVSIAVHSIQKALGLYRDILGGRPDQAGTNDRAGFRVQTLKLPNGGKIELMEPSRPDSFLVRFLEQRGEGMHHITVIVPDIHGAIELLRGHGYTPVQINLERPHWQEAFVHPKESHGALIQLVQSDRAELNKPYE